MARNVTRRRRNETKTVTGHADGRDRSPRSGPRDPRYPIAFRSSSAMLSACARICLRVRPLDEDAHLVLGPGEADEDAAVAAERLLDGRRWRARPRAARASGRFSRTDDVHERLRDGLEAARQLGERPALALHHREHVERRGDAVAGRHVVEEDEVARLLAAEVVAAAAHLLDDVAVADRGADHLRPSPAASARSRPMFDITVATTVCFASVPCADEVARRRAP